MLFILAAGLFCPLAGKPFLPLLEDGFDVPAQNASAPSAEASLPSAALTADSVRIEGMSPQEAIEILRRQGGDTLRPREVKKLARLRKKEEKRLERERKKQEKQRREVEQYFADIVIDTTRTHPVADGPHSSDPLLDSLSIPHTDYYHRDDSTMVGEALMLKKPPAPKPKSAAHAAFLSAIVPGLGQLYGGSQWWMAPVFWGGMTGTLMAVSYYNGYYNDFRKEYKNRIRTGEVHDYEYFDNATLVNRMQYAEQQRDLWIIGTVGIYLLNVLHANVSVQLSEFRIQRHHRKMLELQNLLEQQTAPSTMHFSPAMIHPNEGVNHYPAPGIRLAIDF